MDQPRSRKKREIVATLAVLLVVVAIVAATTVAAKQSEHAASRPVTTSSVSAAKTSGSTASGDFADGAYTATGSYDSPGGTEHITVSLTLSGDTITAASVKPGATDPEAQQYQDDFIGAYKQLVVGKPLAGLHLDRVSGSSLTSQGFNDALQQITQQAHRS